MDLPLSHVVLTNLDLLESVLLNLDYDSILSYCRTYKEAGILCRDEVFWARKARQDFKISLEEFRETELTPAQRYLELLIDSGGVVYEALKYLNIKEFVRRAIHHGRNDQIQYVLDNGFNDWDFLLNEYAAQNDSLGFSRYFLKTYNYQVAAEGALRGGHLGLFRRSRNLASEDTFDTYQWDYDNLAYNAAKSGKIEVFNHLRSLVPENHDWNKFLNKAAQGALESENMKMFEYIRNSDIDWDWNLLMIGAVRSGNLNIYDYLIALAPGDYPWNYNNIVSEALKSGHLELFDITFSDISSVNPNHIWSWGVLINSAIDSGKVEVLNEILNRVPSEPQPIISSRIPRRIVRGVVQKGSTFPNWQLIAERASVLGNQYMFDYIKSKAPLNYEFNSGRLAWKALKSGSKDLFKYIKGDIDHPGWWWETVINGTLETKNIKLFTYVLNTAPSTVNWKLDDLSWGVIKTGDKQFFEEFLARIPKGFELDWYHFTSKALDTGDPKIFMNIVKLAPPNYDFTLTASENPEILKALADYLGERLDWNTLAIRVLAKFNFRNNLENILNMAPSDTVWDKEIFVRASSDSDKLKTVADVFGDRIDWNRLALNTFSKSSLENILKVAPSDTLWRKETIDHIRFFRIFHRLKSSD